MSRKYKSPGTFVWKPEYQAVVDKVSLTVPDEAITVKELLEKHTSGIILDVRRNPFYESDPDIDDPPMVKDPAFDLTDSVQIEETLNRAEEIKQSRKKKSVQKITVPDPDNGSKSPVPASESNSAERQQGLSNSKTGT